MGLFRIVPWLLAASSPPKPQPTNDLGSAIDQLYADLEQPGVRHKQIQPNLRFSYVTPPTSDGDTTWTQPMPDQDEAVKSKPIALFLPGLDGYGVSAARNQFDDLAMNFELWRMTVSPNDRSSFTEMVGHVTEFVWELSEENTRRVVVVGESSGGLIAAAAAIKLARKRENPLQGLVLVNPATSFDHAVWDALFPTMSSFLSTNNRATADVPSERQDARYAALGRLMSSLLIPNNDEKLRILGSIVGLPETPKQLGDEWGAATRTTLEHVSDDVLGFRVSSWLDVGVSVVKGRLDEVDVPTLVVAGQEDAFMPSAIEAERLMKVLPFSEKLLVPNRGHFVLDDSVNLTEAIIHSNIDPSGRKETKPRFDLVRDWTPPSPELA